MTVLNICITRSIKIILKKFYSSLKLKCTQSSSNFFRDLPFKIIYICVYFSEIPFLDKYRSSTRGNLSFEGKKRKISIPEICFALLFTRGGRKNERCHTANNGCVKTPDTRNHLSSTLSCRTVSQLPNWSLCNVDSQCPISCYFHGRQHWHCVTPATDIRNGRGPLCTWFHPMLFSFIDRMDRSVRGCHAKRFAKFSRWRGGVISLSLFLFCQNSRVWVCDIIKFLTSEWIIYYVDEQTLNKYRSKIVNGELCNFLILE